MAKAKKQQTKRTETAAEPKIKRPTILVVEGLSGASAPVRRAGGNAHQVSPYNLDSIESALRGDFDAVLLTGGGDVDPRLYGEKPKKQVYGVNETRDLAEWMVLDEARRRGVPVLGICRGCQLMAVHNGGKLKQHVDGHRGVDHPARTEDGSTFRQTVGETLMTVSLHHQVVLRTGRGWRVAARAADGGIEAIESRDGRCLGVQFHPEMNFGTNADSRSIFRWLVEEASRRSGIKTPPERKPEQKRTSYYDDRPWWDSTQSLGETIPVRKPAPPRKRTNRAAGQRTLPGMLPVSSGSSRSARRGKAPVTITWQCPHCSLRFDEMEDRDDHVLFLHGDDRWVSEIEPPAGHPDTRSGR